MTLLGVSRFLEIVMIPEILELFLKFFYFLGIPEMTGSASTALDAVA